MTTTIKRSLLATATALAFFGCSAATGSISLDDASAGLKQDQTPAAVEAALRQQFADLQSGDSANAFADYSKRCQHELGEANFTVLFRSEGLAIEKGTGSKLSDLELRDVSVEFTPERVAVSAHLYRKDGIIMSNSAPRPAVMIYEDHQWRFADCRHAG